MLQELRDHLRAADAKREIIKADLVNAKTAQQNAMRVVDQAKCNLEEFAFLDDHIVSVRSQGLRCAGVGGAAPMLSESLRNCKPKSTCEPVLRMT